MSSVKWLRDGVAFPKSAIFIWMGGEKGGGDSGEGDVEREDDDAHTVTCESVYLWPLTSGGAVCARREGPVLCRFGASFGVTNNETGICLSLPSSTGESALEITLPIEVGGVVEFRDMQAMELATDVEIESTPEAAVPLPKVRDERAWELFTLLICDIRRPCRLPGLLDRLKLLGLGLGSGCESKICTCRSRPFFGIETPLVRDLPGGTPTRRQVGEGDKESS